MTKITPTSSEVQSIDYWGNLRSDLKEWKNSLKVSDQEIADGLKISRQVVNQFMRWNASEENKNGVKKSLPIYRDDLLSLWEHITSENSIKLCKSREGRENRKKLSEQTPNNFLERAGFLGTERLQSIDYDPKIIEKLRRVISRISNKSLNYRDIWKIEEIIINHLSQLHHNTHKEDEFIEIDRVENWLKDQYQNANQFWLKLESTLKKYKDLGKKKFRKSEVLELFQSIVENQFLRKHNEKRIRVLYYEMKTVNSVYKKLGSSRFNSLLKSILNEGVLMEKELRKLKPEQNLSFNPMNEVTLVCKIGSEEIFWTYRSCSSPLDNMISAIQEGMGHDLNLNDLTSYALAEGSDSISRVSVILKSTEGSFYTGRWVDIDTILSFAQAIIVAAEERINNQILRKTLYYDVCTNLADIMRKTNEFTGEIYEYEFVLEEDSCNDKDVIIAIVDELDKLVVEIDLNLNNIKQYGFEINKNHNLVLRKSKCQALLLQSKYYHIVGNMKEAEIIIKKIQEMIDETGEHNFDFTTIILFEAELMMHKFYIGEPEFFDARLWADSLEIIELKTKDYLKEGKGVGLLTDSFYRALSEIYGNIGKFELHNCGIEKFNIKRLEIALNYSKRAAYFSMKTDDEQRASHWLARCGRILCRLNKSEDASLYIEASREVLTKSRHQYYQRSSALRLEVNMAQGELCLLNDQFEESLIYFFDALQGSMYLRFARIMAGSLYGIYQSSRKVNIVDALADPKLFGDKKIAQIKKICESEKSYKKENIDIFYQTKMIVLEAINCQLSSGHDEISKKFKEQAINIWNGWVEPQNNSQNHPIAKNMFEDTFLTVFK